jgi:tetratricopeptide (TPR) repeat protein
LIDLAEVVSWWAGVDSPTKGDAASTLSQSLFLLGHLLGHQGSRLDEAKEVLAAAAALDPEGRAISVALRRFFEVERPRCLGLEMAYRMAIEAGATLHNQLGLVLAGREGKEEEAEEQFIRALSGTPLDAIPLANLAGHILAVGPVDEGLEALDLAVSKAQELLPFEDILAVISSVAFPDPSRVRNLSGIWTGLWFFAFLHRPLDQETVALQQLRLKLESEFPNGI